MARALFLQDNGRLEEAAVLIGEVEQLIQNQEGLVGDTEHPESFSDSASEASEESDMTYKEMQFREETVHVESFEDQHEKEVEEEIEQKTKPSSYPEYVAPKTFETPQKIESEIPKTKVAETEEVFVQNKREEKPVQDENLKKIQRIISEVAIDVPLLTSGEIKKSALERINEKLKSKTTTVQTSSVPTKANPANEKRMVTKSGILLKAPKEGKLFGKWNKKYVILSGRFLLFFKKQTSRSCEKVVELSNATVEPVAMQIKSKNRNRTEYEVRLREEGGTEIVRLRPCFNLKPGIMTSEMHKREAAQWAASIMNNVVVASKNRDIQTKEFERMKDLQQARDKKPKTLAQALQRLRRTDHDSKGGSNSENLKLLKVQGSQRTRKIVSWDELPNESKMIDTQRKKKYFSPTKNGAPTDIGADIGKRVDDEEIYLNYKLLNVTPSATPSMIKKSYRSLARDLHPDKNINNKEMEERTALFAKIGRAFDVLKFKDTREEYDNGENVKELLRQGIVVRLHRQYEHPKTQLLFIDSRFLNLYLQDVEFGTVLNKGFRSIELRFVTHIYRGLDGFQEANKDVQLESIQGNDWSPPSSVTNTSLSLHGDRIGEQDWHLQLPDVESRDQLLNGLRKLRCDISALFKQRLDEMFETGKL